MKSIKFHFLTTFILLHTKPAKSQNISTLSISICEIIEQFYTKYSRNVDIIDFGGAQGELVTKIMENLNNSMTVTVQKTRNPQMWTKRLQNQSILLFENFLDLLNFNTNVLMEMQYTNPIRILVYCYDATEFILSKLKTDLLLASYFYFIIFDEYDTKLKLFTFENRYNLDECHEVLQLFQINEFSTQIQKWTKEPVFPRKYQNFHGCEMKLGLFSGASNLLRLITKYNFFGLRAIAIEGPLTWIIKDLGQRLNFSVAYVHCKLEGCRDVLTHTYLYNTIRTATLESYALGDMKAMPRRFVMLNIQST